MGGFISRLWCNIDCGGVGIEAGNFSTADCTIYALELLFFCVTENLVSDNKRCSGT